MLSEPVVGGIVVGGFFAIGTIIGLSIFVPLYIELVLGQSASASGLALIAFMVRRDGRLDAGRPADVAARSLQAGADLRTADRDRGARSCLRSGRASCRCSQVRAPAAVGGVGMGADVSDDHGDHPERGAAASARHRDRHAELLPPAWRRASSLPCSARSCSAASIPARAADARQARLPDRRRNSRRRSAGCSLRRRSSSSIALVALLLIEERPLRGPAARAPEPEPSRRPSSGYLVRHTCIAAAGIADLARPRSDVAMRTLAHETMLRTQYESSDIGRRSETARASAMSSPKERCRNPAATAPLTKAKSAGSSTA